MAWRVAKSLLTLREQFNEQFPKRKKSADGTVGDAAHASRSSDHNPHVKDAGVGVVTALDITHDPANGLDAHAIARYMAGKKDQRIKYIISNGQICSSTTSPWAWRKYTGSNKHTSHVHWSVRPTKSLYDSTTRWDIGKGGGDTPGADDSPAARPILRRGSKGEWVRVLQRLLFSTAVDGDFGPNTERSVKIFQLEEGSLNVDGIVGPLTWTALDKIEQIPTAAGDVEEGE
jgi:hypothetical protein